MMPVQFLSEAEHERLNRFPNEIPTEDCFTFFFLSKEDLIEIDKQRSDSSRLGFALQLCALRYMGFVPHDLKSVPSRTLRYVADQLQVSTAELDNYDAGNRKEHLRASHIHVGLRRATELDGLGLEKWLLERALEHDQPTVLFKLASEHLKQQQIARLGTARLARMVSTARSQAQEATYRILQPLLTEECRTLLNKLLEVNETLKRTDLFWLQRTPTDHNLGQLLETLDKILFLQNHGVADWDLSGVNRNRVKLLAKIGSRSTNQYLQRANEVKRYPVLLCFMKQTLYDLTDDLIEMFDQRLWELYSDAKREFKEDRLKATRSINQKLMTFRDIGQILLDPEVDDKTVRKTAFEQIQPEELRIILGETENLIRPEQDAYVDYFCRKYPSIRRFSSKFLSTLQFHNHSQSEDQGLLKALDLIREIHSGNRRQLPPDASTEFVPVGWHSYINETGSLNQRYFELAALWILRQRLRSGDVYTSHSRRYSNLESYFIPKDDWPQHRTEVSQLTGTPLDAQSRLTERKQELGDLIERVESLLGQEDGELREEGGKLILSPLEAEERSARLTQLEDQIYARLPKVDLTDVLVEVDALTGFSEHFEHLNTANQGRSKDLLLNLYACLLSQACNLGLWEIAQSSGLDYHRLCWCNNWYIRDDTLREATKTLVNYHYRLPLSSLWGSGILSSSDGQRFPVKGKVRQARALPPYFGYGKGITFYTWTSDQLSQYGSKPIPSTRRDATNVLDEILNNETDLPILEHTTDTAGYTELISALFDILGYRFSPRIRDLGDQQLYRTADIDMEDYPKLKGHLTKVINEQRVCNSWDEVMWFAGSLVKGHVSASLMVQKLQAYPRKHPLYLALLEYGKLMSTIQTLRWYEDIHTRQRVSRQLNKTEAIHSLKSQVFYAHQGKVKGKPDEQLKNQVGCLNLVSNIIIVWNTIYIEKAVEQLRKEGYLVDDEDLKHIWPTRHRHINVYGRYLFNIDEIRMLKKLRNLRQPTLF
jgi:TnpA family transposase